MARGKVRVDAAGLAQKWSNNTKAATGYMAEGVDRVSVAPGKQAAEKADKMKQNILKSLDSGKWSRRVGAVSLDEWKESMKTKGVARISDGVDGATGKMTGFAEQLIAHENAGLSEISKMPDLTLQDSKNRVVKWIDHMAKFEKK